MYKKIFPFLFIIIALSSCIKEKNQLFTDNVVEFDAASYNSVFGANDFPFLVQTNSVFGRPVISNNTIDPCIHRTNTSARFRVNLIGAVRKTPTKITFSTFDIFSLPAFPAAISYSTTAFPVAFNGTLATAAAVVGTHFTTTGTLTIPSDSSWGYANITILPNTASATTTVVGLQLTGGDVAISQNYKKIGIAINQK